ncbi:TPA: hypothetical protein QDZ10_003000 [Stenotrophomonas maltophilia]|nr:hypothetical protein [Stenotrophomonas maltophilia]
MNFEPRPGSAVDERNGIVITAPRVLPASPPEDPSHIEYQYLIHVHGERVDGLGLFGSDEFQGEGSLRERRFTLDLSRDWVLKAALGFKEAIGNTDEKFRFLQGLAEGLVMANLDESSSKYSIRYVAMTTREALAQCGINLMTPNLDELERDIVLAEARVPVRVG